jgi:hypothetical protein
VSENSLPDYLGHIRQAAAHQHLEGHFARVVRPIADVEQLDSEHLACYVVVLHDSLAHLVVVGDRGFGQSDVHGVCVGVVLNSHRRQTSGKANLFIASQWQQAQACPIRIDSQ